MSSCKVEHTGGRWQVTRTGNTSIEHIERLTASDDERKLPASSGLKNYQNTGIINNHS